MTGTVGSGMLLTTNMLVREAVNGYWLLFSLYALAIFATYLYRAAGRHGWTTKERNKAAIGLFLCFLGNAIFHGWIWFLLRMARLKLTTEFLNGSYSVVVLGAASALVGSVIVILIFSKRRWWHVGGLATLAGAATLLNWLLD